MHHASTIVSLLFHTPWLFSGTFNEIKQLRRESARRLSPRWRASHERETKPRGRTEEGRERCENEKQLGGPRARVRDIVNVSCHTAKLKSRDPANQQQKQEKTTCAHIKLAFISRCIMKKINDREAKITRCPCPFFAIPCLARAPWRRMTRGEQKRKEQR